MKFIKSKNLSLKSKYNIWGDDEGIAIGNPSVILENYIKKIKIKDQNLKKIQIKFCGDERSNMRNNIGNYGIGFVGISQLSNSQSPW